MASAHFESASQGMGFTSPFWFLDDILHYVPFVRVSINIIEVPVAPLRLALVVLSSYIFFLTSKDLCC